MLFSSVSFMVLFAPIVIGLFWVLSAHQKKTSWWLVCASLVFYALAQVKVLPLFLLSVAVNFLFTRKINGKSAALWGGVLFNLLFLGYFKYTNFFIENINVFLGADFPLKNLFLPLGVSFFTFVQIAYLVDLSRGNAQKMRFSDYLLFVGFFPQISAGPIVSYAEMGPQYQAPDREFSWHRMYAALILFLIGFVKKKLADNYAFFAADLYGAEEVTFFWAWVGSLAYTFQLYFDFSGYCDMGLAVAKMMNISLPVNFNSPYKASDIQDFWRRWHITLSLWLRNYLYIPLGGSRKGLARTLLNFFVVFLLGGFWHGAGWTFILWGALHGTALGVHRLWKQLNRPMPKIAGIFLTFLFVHLAWVFFRADSAVQAVGVIREMFMPTNFAMPEWVTIRKYVFQCLIGVWCVFGCPNSMQIFEKAGAERKTFWFAVALILIGLFLTVQANSSPAFLYFKF